MTKFIAYVNQTNNGCDYTIACGKTLWKLKAIGYKEALLELRRDIVPPLEDDEGIRELESVTLYEVASEMSVPIEQWYSEREKEEANYKARRKEEKELMEYQRLSKKFERS